MSDNIPPFDIQTEIMKRVPDVKSLLRFRAVSKPWKSFIDSSQVIAGYGARDTQPHTLLLSYKLDNSNEVKFVSFVDHENDNLTQQQQDFTSNVMDLMKETIDLKVIGSSHGLFCFSSDVKDILLLWNPSLRKSVCIRLPYLPVCYDFLGFVVCPANNDPTIVTIRYPWHVGIFTLSSKRFTKILYTKLTPKSIRPISSHVVIDSCIYWPAHEFIRSMGGSYRYNYMIMSYDLIAKDIRLVDMPLNNRVPRCVFISKLRESLVLFVSSELVDCGVWKMAQDASFTKLFTINTPNYTINNILGFRKNGELVMETQKDDKEFPALEVYDPCSERISNLGIYGEKGSFFVDSYKETLLLLDELDSCLCSDFS